MTDAGGRSRSLESEKCENDPKLHGWNPKYYTAKTLKLSTVRSAELIEAVHRRDNPEEVAAAL